MASAADRAIGDCVAAMMTALAEHAALPAGHTAEPIKVIIEHHDQVVDAAVVWRDVRPDGSSRLRESKWTMGRSLVPRSPR